MKAATPQYAGRPGCTAYEVNNFQTETHFDWVAPIFTDLYRQAVPGNPIINLCAQTAKRALTPATS